LGAKTQRAVSGKCWRQPQGSPQKGKHENVQEKRFIGALQTENCKEMNNKHGQWILRAQPVERSKRQQKQEIPLGLQRNIDKRGFLIRSVARVLQFRLCVYYVRLGGGITGHIPEPIEGTPAIQVTAFGLKALSICNTCRCFFFPTACVCPAVSSFFMHVCYGNRVVAALFAPAVATLSNAYEIVIKKQGKKVEKTKNRLHVKEHSCLHVRFVCQRAAWQLPQ